MSCTTAETSTTVLSPFSTPSLKSSKYRIFIFTLPGLAIEGLATEPRGRSAGVPGRAYTASPAGRNRVVCMDRRPRRQAISAAWELDRYPHPDPPPQAEKGKSRGPPSQSPDQVREGGRGRSTGCAGLGSIGVGSVQHASAR